MQTEEKKKGKGKGDKKQGCVLVRPLVEKFDLAG
jgi:hypothetical protein